MEYKITIKHPSCCGEMDGLIKINVQKYIGKLFINWINLPKSCTILNSGKTVKNVPAGRYLLELEDDQNFANNKKQIYIDVDSPEELKIDFYRTNQPKCFEDSGSIEVFFSGGTPPYTISYHKFLTQTTDTYYKFDNIYNLTSGYIKIKDKNGCYITSSNIHIIRHKPDIQIEIFEPSAFSLNDGSAKLYLKNIEEPKIRWYKLPDKNTPINIGSISMIKNLGAGDYYIKIIDNNDCEINKYFSINQPQPTTLKFVTKPDYSYGTEYNSSFMKPIYNTILVPNSDSYSELLKIVPSDIIRIKNKNNTNKYKVIHQPTKITIEDIEYLALYILPGYNPNITNKSLVLIFNQKEYNIYPGFSGNYNNPHICATFAILEDNYKYAFNVDDRCIVKHNNTFIDNTIDHIQNYYNLYDMYTHNTCIWFKFMTKKFLSQINKNLHISSPALKSLDTKYIQKKGSIFIRISGQYNKALGVYNDGVLYKYKLVCYNADKSYYNIFYMNDTYLIDSLDAGKYTIEIENYNLDYVNNLRTHNNYFEFTIDQSNNNQNIFAKQHTLPKFKHVPTNQTGLYLNIVPHNTKCKLYNDNNYILHLDSTYEVITDLIPGKYYLSIEDQIKEFYITKNQMLTINTLK